MIIIHNKKIGIIFEINLIKEKNFIKWKIIALYAHEEKVVDFLLPHCYNTEGKQ